MVAECGRAIVVDNGSDVEACDRMRGIAGVEVVALGENQGIAVALNHGLARAAETGAAWVVTFDQDSRPAPGFVRALLATRASRPRAAVVGSYVQEAAVPQGPCWLRPHPRFPLFFQRTPAGSDLDGITMVVTSGALTELATWRALGGFDEDLFIDYVDTDYCLRCRLAGRTIAVSVGAHLAHHLGRREARKWVGRTFYPTHHSPLRHYYVARNRVRMIRRHALREPHWFLFDCAAAALWLFRVLAFESAKAKKLRAMLLGTWDGLRGRFGPCPPARKQALGG
jgi:rhamnosyltransferase